MQTTGTYLGNFHSNWRSSWPGKLVFKGKLAGPFSHVINFNNTFKTPLAACTWVSPLDKMDSMVSHPCWAYFLPQIWRSPPEIPFWGGGDLEFKTLNQSLLAPNDYSYQGILQVWTISLGEISVIYTLTDFTYFKFIILSQNFSIWYSRWRLTHPKLVCCGNSEGIWLICCFFFQDDNRQHLPLYFERIGIYKADYPDSTVFKLLVLFTFGSSMLVNDNPWFSIYFGWSMLVKNKLN